ncbi:MULTISPECIES: hypothetical protein [Serratia]|uniref:hypothetical protein n=1 Tax=Serratia TaxID=613 RepID=UPI00074541C9|nr:hypothetical protein [Serratia marcescens]MDX7489861.1 hypothetical protein [Serratia marcescens]QIX78364.1 hypothetical protein FOB67_18185 [Serratia marcescens]RZA46740.1 hypothetical protein EVY46_24090 [Serratia marcescens]CVH38302.1 Uncharacterised protein [Serratia marcescens]BEL72440.1 hypothetical protein SM10VA4_34640 [Serratia marcescens]
MKKIVYIGFLFIALVISFYYFNFGMEGKISKSTEVWGQFGDYLGGVINPILTFLSIVLLVKTINLQREANTSILDENRRQERLDHFKNFEVRFYNLIDSQRTYFMGFKLRNVDAGDEIKVSSDAVAFLEEMIFDCNQKKMALDELRAKINDIDGSDAIYSAVRHFYLLVKLIDDKLSGEEQKEYYEVLINLTDYHLIRLLVLSTCVYDWDSILYIEKSDVLGSKELRRYKSNFLPAP